MLRLYEILKTSKTKVAPDLWTRLAAEKMAGSGGKVRELTGIPPLTFTANGQPLLDYTIYGNMEQSSTPAPDAPITPSECGERTRNLFDKDNADIVDLYPDTTTREIKQSSNLSTWSIVLPVESSTTYTFTMGEATTAIRRRVGMCSDYPTKGAYCTSVDDTPEYDHPNLGNIFTTDADTRYVLIMYVSGAGRDVAIERANRVQVVKGDTALPYEPYGYKIPISSANTTTPVYLGEVETTRKIGKIDLGTLNWSKTASGNFWADRSIPNCRIVGNELIGNAICTHFTEVSANSVANTPYSFSSCLNSQARPFINKTGFENLTGEEFKQAMSGVYIYYVLATPETGIVNEPIRKIGNYADTVSMEQAGVSISTLNGQTVVDVDTTLKPSEMYIKYKG